MRLQNKVTRDELDVLETVETLESVENSLEELSLYMIKILKEYRKKGLIGEEEYNKHIRIKQEYLAFLQEKRKSTAVI